MALLILTTFDSAARAQESSFPTPMNTPPTMTCGEAQVAPMAPTTFTKDSLVAMTFGGVAAEPHVPWFLLPRSSFAPMTLPPSPASPYTIGATGTIPDNPPLMSGFPFHANITRHWPGGTASYVIVVPRTVPNRPGAPGIPDLSQPVYLAFPGLPINASYRWDDWVRDVQRVFAKYNAVQTADVNVSFAGVVYESERYSRTEGAVPAVLGPVIWPNTSSGPTGNGVNEIILTDQPITGLGLTSMLVDPTKGHIVECDVIFNVGISAANTGANPGFFQTIPGTSNVTTPREWTGLPHEIGHFYGLDHTNLHPGVAFPSAIPPTSYAAGTGGSRARYPVTLVNPLAPPFPMMVGSITYLGAGSNVAASNFQLPVDDQVGLSIIYPVDMPRPLSAKVPLKNLTASVRGKCLENPTGFGIFGRNVWVLQQGSLDVQDAGFPVTGVISGTARNTDDPLLLQTPSLYVDNTTTSPNPFYAVPSWVGAPWGPGTPAPAQQAGGDFSIDGIPASADLDLFNLSSDPIEYDVILENSSLLGVAGGGGNQAEWFGMGGILMYTGNPLTPSPPLPTGNTHPTIPYALTSLENIDPSSGAPGAASPVESLSVVAGTVIYINPKDINNDQLVALPGGNPPMPPTGWESTLQTHPGPPIDRFREQSVRPLVSITPRLGRSTATNVVITARLDTTGGPTSLFGFDTTAAILLVNGTPFTLPAPAVTSFVTGTTSLVPAPGAARWTISMSTIVAFAGVTSNQPIELVFTLPAMVVGPTPGSFGIDPGNLSQTRRIVLAVGRNDVVL